MELFFTTYDLEPEYLTEPQKLGFFPFVDEITENPQPRGE
jgi:hypothetical protein